MSGRSLLRRVRRILVIAITITSAILHPVDNNNNVQEYTQHTNVYAKQSSLSIKLGTISFV